MKWPTWRRSSSRISIRPIAAVLPPPEPLDDVDLPTNLAALELALDVGDWMLGMGSPSSEVVTTMLAITRRFCPRRVHVDITSVVITASQARLNAEPLTLIRQATPRALNHATLQAIQECVGGFERGISIHEAKRRFSTVLGRQRTNPWWMFMICAGAVSAGAAALFSASPRMLLLTFLVGCLADRLLAFLARRAVPPFFGNAAAALVITLSAAALATVSHLGIPWFRPLNPTIIVVGGIVMLVVGMMFVGAVQDAIDAFYVTASGRLLQVVILTAGIVVGILVGVFTSRHLHLGVLIQATPLAMTTPAWQLLGAGIIAGAFALYCQSTWLATLWSAGLGFVSWGIFLLAALLGLSDTPASAVAAVVAGLLGTLISTRLRMSDFAVTQAGIVMLVPGLRLYTALMQLVNFPAEDPRFLSAVSQLSVAIGIGLAIAAGSSLGTLIGRPLRQQLRLARNRTLSVHERRQTQDVAAAAPSPSPAVGDIPRSTAVPEQSV